MTHRDGQEPPKKSPITTGDMFRVLGAIVVCFGVPAFFMLVILILKDFGEAAPSEEAGYLYGELALLLYLFRMVSKRLDGRKDAGLFPPVKKSAWLTAFVLYIPFFCILAVSFAILRHLTNMGAFEQGTPIVEPDLANRILSIVAILLRAVTMEVIYRGICLAGFRRKKSDRFAIAATSVISGIVGLSFGRAVFGAIPGLIRIRTGSLYCCIAVQAAHMYLRLAARHWFESMPKWFTYIFP